jgi:hypothetical protein
MTDTITIADAFAAINADEIRSAEDLAQRFSDRRAERWEGFLRDCILAHIADGLGAEGRNLASNEAGWSPQTIARMAMLLDARVPESLFNPDLPLGVYWQVWNSDLPREGKVDDAGNIVELGKVVLTAKAIKEGWSVADVKEAMGLEAERTGGSVYHCEAVDQNGDTVTISGEELQSAELKGYPVSVRRLKR